jgi:hypothetical protein
MGASRAITAESLAGRKAGLAPASRWVLCPRSERAARGRLLLLGDTRGAALVASTPPFR